MQYRLSDHAKKRLQQRGIKQEWLAAALAMPDITENDAEDATLVHALKEIPEKGFKRLRVIYNESIEPVTIVTAYFE
ncbi:DUF4258 domain-containing protein [Thiothrix litoralis]|jgi:hypothetical protein|uniref:DUF4258 domain-containing protein n=2 Tax=Thiothrix TaxID=1030 RepID=A0ABY9MSS4_9GAMM|nr:MULTISPECIES: DUF4258 domain-containing protein [Thiothrix]QTR46648.1 DUF4258 domain-containing protein [Thiothrix litoralis]WML91692.1 DUF4258 domain-containing protein [Thiothrix lacustris]